MSNNGQDEVLNLLCEEGEGTKLRLMCHDLLTKNQFVDVTLSCVDGQIQAHRLVLCAVSGYLYELFTANPTMNPCTHPMIILRDCRVAEVQLALQYVYGGRARIQRSQLPSLLNAARELGCDALERAVNRALQSTCVQIQVVPQSKPMPQLQPPVAARIVPQGSQGHQAVASVPSRIGFAGRPAEAVSMSQNSRSRSPGCGGIKSLLSQITKAINIKTEQRGNTGNTGNTASYEQVVRKRSRSPSPNSMPPMPKLLRMTPSPVISPVGIHHQGQGPFREADPLSPSPIPRESMLQDGLSHTIMQVKEERLQLQHDKAESFVYTNENLDMMMFGNDDINDLDESEDTPYDIQIKTEPVEDEEPVDRKPSACPWCNELFGSAAQLQRHIKALHTNAIYKPYACPYCAHEFGRSAHLKRHIRSIHTSEKPYKCEYCDKEFSRQDKMKIHITRHLQGSIPMNGSTTSNEDLVRTCYPPVSMSQNCGGQVPIKILIPKNNQPAATSRPTNNEITQNETQFPPGSLSPSSFFNDRTSPSITINAVPTPKQVPPNRQPKRSTPQLNTVAN